ncbi:related to MMS21 - SUMO ligase and component of the SMC5-SMC6 complex [Melanopsichium pennsylvanicum]|uniref:Related to MMS21 - SUMO ligase and component of the SMC5-SMC6 complex n=2 Tax=Melanopsichium pennsylvanicum TaxID=63383 RepID=A0AAJ4XK16_9BASI|nr:conserved hypothetical protein [Melanopsichium pennsylvanicum 4]SNX84174.1 related to MMS21 - SUMO ligase and component of the SMC5-SMC6 complex [Melanopsichium pennsylvanicum]
MPASTRRHRVNDTQKEAHVAPASQPRTKPSNTTDISSASTRPSRSQRTAATTNSSNDIDLNSELRAQALTHQQVPSIRSLISDLKAQDSSLLKCIELLNETADQVAEAFRTQTECQELKQAELDLKDLIDAQAEKAVRRKVLEDMVQELSTGASMVDPATRYKSDVQSAMDTYNKQTSRKKYSKNADYHNFKNTLWVANNDGAMPPVRDLIPSEPGDENDDSDDDLQMGGATQNFRCPLTTNILEDPVSNAKCSHSYSKSAIEDYVNAGNNRCPASGCQALVSRATLKLDPALTKKVAAFKRREEERLIARRATSTVLY